MRWVGLWGTKLFRGQRNRVWDNLSLYLSVKSIFISKPWRCHSTFMISNLFSLSLELYRSDQPVYSGVFIACCSLRFLLGWQYHLGSRFFTLGSCRFHCLADLVAYITPLSRRAVCLINLYQLGVSTDSYGWTHGLPPWLAGIFSDIVMH